MLQGRTRQTPTAAVAASNRRAVAAVVASAVLFGTTGTTQELGPEGITPYGLGAVRVLIGALTLWVIVGHAPRLAAVRTPSETVKTDFDPFCIVRLANRPSFLFSPR